MESDGIDRLNAYKAYVNQALADHYTRMQYPFAFPTVDYKISQHWAKFTLSDGSVHSFVALHSFVTKGLGQVMVGDIYKAASSKAPAKGARGSIFKEDFGKPLSQAGSVNYLV